MKKTNMMVMTVLAIAALAMGGCASERHSVASVDAATGNKTTTTDKSTHSDNAAMTVIGSVVKYTGDAMTAILPPLIPLIVGGLTKPVTTPAAAAVQSGNAPASQ